MSNPTTASFWNQTTPAVPAGDQACVIQSDGVTPQDSRTVYPKTATNTLRGVVKPDTTTITVDGSGTLSAKPMVGDTGSGGAAGIVPAPPSGSAAAGKYLKADGTYAVPAASGSAGGDLGGSYPNPTVTATHLAAPLPVVQGGTGTATPGIVAGANVTVSGTWPNQTVNSTASSTLPSGAANLIVATPNGSSGASALRAMVGNDLPAVAGVSGTYASPSSITVDGHGRVTAAVAGGTPGYLGVSTMASQVVSGTGTISVTKTVTSGNAIILSLFDDFNGPGAVTSLSVADSAGNTYTAMTNYGWPSIYPYIATNVVGGSLTFTVTYNASTTFTLIATEWSNVAASSPGDGDCAHWSHATFVYGDPGTLTTTTAGDLLISFLFISSDTATPTSGFTQNFTAQDPNNGFRVYVFSEIAGAAGAYTNSVTYTGGAIGAGLITLYALKPGTSTGGTTGGSGVTSFNGRTGAVVPASGDYTAAQVTGAATQAAIQQESYTYSADTGAANAYAVTLSPVPTIVAGSVVCFKAANTNTGASTLAVNGGSATAIRKNGTNVLSAGDIAVGQIIDATYDGTYWQIIVPGTGGGSSISLTTTGSSGAATLTGSVLNIPVYSGGGGGGGVVLLEAHTASSSSELDFTGWYSSSYDEYLIEFVNLVPATNSSNLYIQCSTNGGTSYDSGSNYAWSQYGFDFSGASAEGSGADTRISTGASDRTISSTASFGGLCMTLRLYSPASTSMHKSFIGNGVFFPATGSRLAAWTMGAQYLSLSAMNAFRVYFSSGNIASGAVRIYGVSH